MSEPVRYGQLKSEKIAEENDVCRNIAKEISQFGITERQRLFLIHTLAMELEDVQVMLELTACIKELTKSNIFLSTQEDEKVSGVITLWEDQSLSLNHVNQKTAQNTNR